MKPGPELRRAPRPVIAGGLPRRAIVLHQHRAFFHEEPFIAIRAMKLDVQMPQVVVMNVENALAFRAGGIE